jgi:hypothetical protein
VTLLNPLGSLPIRRGPVRFAVGLPDGLTSNAWRVWTGKHGDVYIACRDNFKEAKVSLHTSGRWRMAYTSEAITKNISLLSGEENRAWEVWDKPPATLPGVVTAFHLVFPTAELAVRPEQRVPDEWKNVVYIEAAPPGQMVNVTLFVTVGDPILQPEYGRSFRLASLAITDGRCAQLVAYEAPEANIPTIITRCVSEARAKAQSDQIDLPPEAYGYFFGRRDDGSRFIVGARV